MRTGGGDRHRRRAVIVTGDGEVFWGNDRLEQGLDWAAGRR